MQTVISLAEMSERMNMTCVFRREDAQDQTADGKPVEHMTYGSMPIS